METGIDPQQQMKIDELKDWRHQQLADLQNKSIDIRGKRYVQVAQRVLAFNDIYPGGSITTDLISTPEAETVIIKATVWPEGTNAPRFFTGYSQAKWGEGHINKTAALENAETSAVGRALGFMGIGVIESIASVDEMVKANGRARGDITAEQHEAGFLNPDHHVYESKTRRTALEEALLQNGHSQMAQSKFLGEHGYKQWEQVLNKDWEAAIKWASSKPVVPPVLTEAVQESVGMVKAAQVLAAGVVGSCPTCKGKLLPSKYKGGQPFCPKCYKSKPKRMPDSAMTTEKAMLEDDFRNQF